ncbi:hypothetical protein CYFUS_003298 [Cystobacter fuscus]|uniref:Uncharacterized protein n=1 Tax=Cystobacter fuscus TaxID=43 RepID=A0A250J2S1_9BACT|nr:hypothetical protein CYFUS_003298 [Cystobacter fuscus]
MEGTSGAMEGIAGGGGGWSAAGGGGGGRPPPALETGRPEPGAGGGTTGTAALDSGVPPGRRVMGTAGMAALDSGVAPGRGAAGTLPAGAGGGLAGAAERVGTRAVGRKEGSFGGTPTAGRVPKGAPVEGAVGSPVEEGRTPDGGDSGRDPSDTVDTLTVGRWPGSEGMSGGGGGGGLPAPLCGGCDIARLYLPRRGAATAGRSAPPWPASWSCWLAWMERWMSASDRPEDMVSVVDVFCPVS